MIKIKDENNNLLKSISSEEFDKLQSETYKNPINYIMEVFSFLKEGIYFLNRILYTLPIVHFWIVLCFYIYAKEEFSIDLIFSNHLLMISAFLSSTSILLSKLLYSNPGESYFEKDLLKKLGISLEKKIIIYEEKDSN